MRRVYSRDICFNCHLQDDPTTSFDNKLDKLRKITTLKQRARENALKITFPFYHHESPTTIKVRGNLAFEELDDILHQFLRLPDGIPLKFSGRCTFGSQQKTAICGQEELDLYMAMSGDENSLTVGVCMNKDSNEWIKSRSTALKCRLRWRFNGEKNTKMNKWFQTTVTPEMTEESLRQEAIEEARAAFEIPQKVAVDVWQNHNIDRNWEMSFFNGTFDKVIKCSGGEMHFDIMIGRDEISQRWLAEQLGLLIFEVRIEGEKSVFKAVPRHTSFEELDWYMQRAFIGSSLREGDSFLTTFRDATWYGREGTISEEESKALYYKLRAGKMDSDLVVLIKRADALTADETSDGDYEAPVVKKSRSTGQLDNWDVGCA